jgi:hypothetical protein
LFYSSPFLKVKRKEAVFFDPEDKFVDIEDNLSFMEATCLILASKGYCGGNPELISKMSVSWVLKLRDYNRFTIDYKLEKIK